MRWGKGEADIEQLTREAALERVDGAMADGRPWLARASKTLTTAEDIADSDPESAYVLGYDAARHACVALLAHQEVRPTTSGGHLVVERAVRAQFGDAFRSFGALRRRRNELEYPAYPGEHIDLTELHDALTDVRTILERADALLDNLGRF